MSRNLLIVDDEPEIKEVLQILLDDITENIFVAADGKEAFDLCKSQNIDCILSDLKMPNVDGLQFLQNLRDANIETPFIFLTGYADTKSEELARKLGVKYFLKKPFNATDLFSAISSLLEGSEST